MFMDNFFLEDRDQSTVVHRRMLDSISNSIFLVLFLHNTYDTLEIPDCGNLIGADWIKNLRWANTEPFMHFNDTNTEPSMHFRKANTDPSMHFRKAKT